VELYLQSPNTPSWRGAKLGRAQGQLYLSYNDDSINKVWVRPNALAVWWHKMHKSPVLLLLKRLLIRDEYGAIPANTAREYIINMLWNFGCYIFPETVLLRFVMSSEFVNIIPKTKYCY
jgi:hypothetical protein